MSSIIFDPSDENPMVPSKTDQRAVTSSPHNVRARNDSTSSQSHLYTAEQLKSFLVKRNRRFQIVQNDKRKMTASWWRSFGYIAVKNQIDEFEQIDGYIACFKCFITFRYGQNSGTKHFMDADRCYPLAQRNTPADRTSDRQSNQIKLDQVGFRRKITLTSKERCEVNNLHARWICHDMRPFTIVEDYGFEHLASMFVKIGKKKNLV